MPENTTNYHSVEDMSAQRTVPGRRFYPYVAGKTNGAEREIISMMRRLHQVKVDSMEDCDYVLLFCPVASRVETDINEAFSKVQTDKPIILIVMHHTFDPNRIIAESRRRVDKQNVLLTVDVLFYEGKLLDCNRNNISYHEVGKVLGAPVPQKSWSLIQSAKDNPCITCVILGIVLIIFTIVVVSVVETTTKT